MALLLTWHPLQFDSFGERRSTGFLVRSVDVYTLAQKIAISRVTEAIKNLQGSPHE